MAVAAGTAADMVVVITANFEPHDEKRPRATGAVFFWPEHNPAAIGSAGVQPQRQNLMPSAILRERWSA
jgi:hypothetical protein